MNIPVKCMDANGRTVVSMEQWPIIDVHDTMSFLFREAKINIPSEKLLEYWTRSKQYGEPWAQTVPENEMHRTIPIGLYMVIRPKWKQLSSQNTSWHSLQMWSYGGQSQ